MFYCKSCAVENGWPHFDGMFMSRGPCEMCGKTADCADVPSKNLPPSIKAPEKEEYSKAEDPAQIKTLIELGILNDQGHPKGCGCECCGGAG